MNPISKSDIVKAVEEGRPVVVVEYRGSQVNEISYRDKASGRAISNPILVHTVENKEGASFKVTEWLAEDFDVAGWKAQHAKAPVFVKGQRVAVWVNSWNVAKGNTEVRGYLQVVADGNPEPGASASSRSPVR